MEEIVITWRELLIAVLLATVIYLLETLLLNRRRQAGAKPEPSNGGMANELAQLREEVVVLRRRLDALQELVDKTAKPETGVDGTPYGQAANLARQGLPPQEVAERCGISRAEAELIVSLHRSSS